MSTHTLTGALCAAALIVGTPQDLRAQPGSPAGPGAPSERPGKPHWKKHGQPGGPMVPGLPPEEAKRLATAREKAKDDPTVRSLIEARDALDEQLEQAVNAAILAADPGLAPTLEKVKQSRNRAKGIRDRFESLTPEQREQLKSARLAAKNATEVVAAREKMKSADSPEARLEAGKALFQAMKAAMIRQDPGLAALLERLGPGGEGAL
jgi:hypothetical protein